MITFCPFFIYFLFVCLDDSFSDSELIFWEKYWKRKQITEGVDETGNI